MKRKQLIKILLMLISIVILTGCTSENNPINKRYMEDRSDQLPDIALSDEQFVMLLRQEVIPINNSIYTLSMQAQQLKAGVGDMKTEIERVDTILGNIQNTIEKIMDMKVSQKEEARKKNVIDALNNLKIQLTSYKTILSSDNATKASIQTAIDIIMSALETLKQYTT